MTVTISAIYRKLHYYLTCRTVTAADCKGLSLLAHTVDTVCKRLAFENLINRVRQYVFVFILCAPVIALSFCVIYSNIYYFDKSNWSHCEVSCIGYLNYHHSYLGLPVGFSGRFGDVNFSM